MGLPMYVSPSLSKRQLPPKQQQQNSQTSYYDSSVGGDATSQNSRTSAFEIPEWQIGTIRNGGGGVGDSNSSQRSERRRRSLSYDVHQHIQRLHQLQHLHRTREQMAAASSSSSNIATRRGLQAAHLINLQNEQGMQQRHISLPPLRSPVRFRPNDEHRLRHRDHNNNSSNRQQQTISSNTSSNTSSAALDDVIRRVNILRQMAQHQERLLRPRYRSSHSSHRASSSSSIISPSSATIIPPTTLSPTTPTSSAGTTTTSSSTSAVRDELLQQMRLPRISIENPTLVGGFGTLPAPSSLNNHRSNDTDDEETSSSTQSQHTRILSPIPRRYNHNNTYSNALAAVSSNVVELDEDGYEVDGNNLRDQYLHFEATNPIIATTTADAATNTNTSNHDDIILQRSSASGECC
ncbi:8978_t:CDS:2 [Ambispora gerdemannii]|uniref:8978_t:CDS:1 n=1 Tax=Ambispora gerdemannii TaxID=144530 RepID=A0A9N8Z1M3_9GLOM|nr:8978_t:CDS:2 [Ambispora gerdemannii]